MDEEKRQYDENIKNGQEKLSDAAKDRAKKEAIKKIIKIIGVKGVAIVVIVIIATSILATLFLAAAVYLDDLDTKTKASKVKETAIGNEPLDTILAMEDGKYKISYNEEAGKDAIESILEDADMNFEDFNNEEIDCLYKCLKAEWATTYPNLGQDVDNKDIDSEYVQGVITVKRGNLNGNVNTLTYKPYEEFTTIKDQTALDYFSMKDGNIIVANWSSNDIIYTPSDSMPEDIKSQYVNAGEQISITETPIDYRSMIGIHTIPFELLLSLLVNTENVDFVNELADLAFSSTIEITVYDNVTEIINTETEHINEITTYRKWVDYYITTEHRVPEIPELPGLSGINEQYAPSIGSEESNLAKRYIYDEEINSTEKEEVDYTLTTKRITKNNSYVIGLTNVSSWLANIKNEYIYLPKPGSEENLDLGEPYIYEPKEKEKESIPINDPEVVIFRNSKQSTSITEDDNGMVKTETCTITGARRQGTLNGLNELTKNTIQINEYKYESPVRQVSNIGEKFEEIYDNNSGAQAQLNNVSSWLFELLEESSSTVDYVYIMKYLLYICTGEDYGVTELDDLSLFDSDELTSATGGGSALWNNDITKDEFISTVKNYIVPSGSGKYGTYKWGYERYFIPNSENFYDIATSYGLDPRFIFCIGIHESGFGTSAIANEKGNFFGWNANDSNPYGDASSFYDMSSGIETVCKGLANQYVSSNGSWYQWIIDKGYNPTTIQGIGCRYASDSNWANAVIKHMRNIFNYEPGFVANGSFLEVAKECHDYIRQNNYSYIQGTTIPADENSVSGIDCSAYVTWVLYEYGYTELKGHQKTCRWFMNTSTMQKMGWTVLPATQAEAGDIVVNSHHMEIYAGDGKFYNAGSTEAIRREISNCGVGYLNDFTYAIRVTPPGGI